MVKNLPRWQEADPTKDAIPPWVLLICEADDRIAASQDLTFDRCGRCWRVFCRTCQAAFDLSFVTVERCELWGDTVEPCTDDPGKPQMRFCRLECGCREQVVVGAKLMRRLWSVLNADQWETSLHWLEKKYPISGVSKPA